MADSMALALLGIKGYDIESIEDAYGKDKHYKKISLKYSGEILINVLYADSRFTNMVREGSR